MSATRTIPTIVQKQMTATTILSAEGLLNAYITRDMVKNNSTILFPHLWREVKDYSLAEFAARFHAGKLPHEFYDLLEPNGYVDDPTGTFYYYFTGSVKTAFPEKTSNPIDRMVNENYLNAVCVVKEGTAEEMKAACAAALRSIELPADFDLWPYIVTVEGSYYD